MWDIGSNGVVVLVFEVSGISWVGLPFEFVAVGVVGLDDAGSFVVIGVGGEIGFAVSSDGIHGNLIGAVY